MFWRDYWWNCGNLCSGEIGSLKIYRWWWTCRGTHGPMKVVELWQGQISLLALKLNGEIKRFFFLKNNNDLSKLKMKCHTTFEVTPSGWAT